MKTLIIEERERLEAIIRRCRICFVGMTDETGAPYVLPMNFGYEAGVLYLHSGPQGSKLDMLRRDNRVCITFSTGHELVYQHEQVACSYSMRGESVLCRGRVCFIEDTEEKRRALDIFMRHYTDRPFSYSAPALRHVCVWRIEVEQMSGKAFGLRAAEV